MRRLFQVVLSAVLIAWTMAAGAQSHASKRPSETQSASSAAARASAGGPTKVTGDGTTTSSGLKYWDIKEGTGPAAVKGQIVKVHYTGWLTTGKKFDSSVDAGRPFSFKLGAGDVIKGWDEGVAGMKAGGKRQLRIPADLAYGERGYPGVIPPNSTLIFDVELLGMQ